MKNKSSYFKTQPKDTGQSVYDRGTKMLEGQVVKIHFTDDATNKSKKFVEYDVVARDAKGGTSTYRNVRNAMDVSGFSDFKEVILEPNEAAIQGKLDKSNFSSNMNGTMVLLAFLDGSFDKPLIIGGFSHRRKEGAKREDGIRTLWEFRGVEFNIDKNGDFTITQRGARTPQGKFQREDTEVNTQIKLDKEGNFSLNDSENNTIELDRENKKINIIQKDGTKEINKISLCRDEKKMTTNIGEGTIIQELDGNAEKVTLTTKSGMTVEVDGASDTASYTTSGGPTVSIDGAGNITLDANGTTIVIDGTSGKIELTGNLVDVGASASALAALGPQLVSWLSSHTHLYSPGPGGPTPSAPPTVPPPATLLSTTVKIKS